MVNGEPYRNRLLVKYLIKYYLIKDYYGRLVSAL